MRRPVRRPGADRVAVPAGRGRSVFPGGSALARTASAAATTGGAIRTIPGPPPNGRSSTCLCLPSAQSRRSQRSMATRCLSIARRTMLWLRKPSRRAGKRVSTSMRSEGEDMVVPCRSGGLRRWGLRGRSRRSGCRLGQLPGFTGGRLLDPVLLQERLHLIRRLGPDTQPVANPVDLQDSLGFGIAAQRVVVAEFLDGPAVPGLSASPWRRSGRTADAGVPSISSEYEPLAFSSHFGRSTIMARSRQRAGWESPFQVKHPRSPVPSPCEAIPVGPSQLNAIQFSSGLAVAFAAGRGGRDRPGNAAAAWWAYPTARWLVLALRGGVCVRLFLVVCAASHVPWARAVSRCRPWGRRVGRLGYLPRPGPGR